jgi:hypothetical protein
MSLLGVECECAVSFKLSGTVPLACLELSVSVLYAYF